MDNAGAFGEYAQSWHASLKWTVQTWCFSEYNNMKEITEHYADLSEFSEASHVTALASFEPKYFAA